MKTLTIFLLGAISLLAQCDAPVVDNAHVFGEKIHQVEQAAQALVQLGADVRVRTITAFIGPNLEWAEKTMEAECPSWKTPDGGRKNNLIVFLAAIQNRKTGVYFGSQWKPALDQQWTRVQAEVMNPRFRDRDFAGGFTDGMGEVGKLIRAYRDVPFRSAAAPAAVVVHQQPTDLSGLWLVFMWILILGATGIAIWGLIFLMNKRRERKEAKTGAQQAAFIAQQQVTKNISDLDSKFPAYEALAQDKEAVKAVRGMIDSVSEQYSALKQSGVADPNREDLNESQYRAIQDQYVSLNAKLRQASDIMNGRDMVDPWTKRKTYSPPIPKKPPEEKHHRATPRPTPAQPAPAPAAVPVREGDTMIFVNNESNYQERSSESPSYSRRSSDDDYSSSGSSSWGGSSDSGGSSDFGSSSDSGGSSDFGGGDSGGGGSSDW